MLRVMRLGYRKSYNKLAETALTHPNPSKVRKFW